MSDNTKKNNPLAELFRIITGKKPITASGQVQPTQSTGTAKVMPASTGPVRQAPPVQNIQTEAPISAKAAHTEKTYKVTGISHYMAGIMALAIENNDYYLKKKELIESGKVDERVYKYLFYPGKTEVVPEPDNPHDPKAIKVLVDGSHVGYIKAGSCAHLLKVIREDRIVKIRCEMYGGPYKYVSEEWDDEKGMPAFVYEADDMPYRITLTITEK